MVARFKRRPEGSNWGDFGDDDQLGSLNFITPECVKKATACISSGLSFCLSLPLDYPGGRILAPHRHPPILRPTDRKGEPYFNFSFKKVGRFFCDVGCDDAVTLCTQYSTQWDSFAHIGAEFDLMGEGIPESCFYNGYRAGVDIRPPQEREPSGAMPLGIDRFAVKAIQSRGVLIDIVHHFGRGEQSIGLAQVEEIMSKDQIVVEPGDILCLHTGFADEILKMNKQPDESVHSLCATLDGQDESLKGWLAATKVAALAADNYAVEKVDVAASQNEEYLLPLHHHCLFKRGIPLGELWFLSELASALRKQGRFEFLLTAPPLRLPGAVGSPVTPIATI